MSVIHIASITLALAFGAAFAERENQVPDQKPPAFEVASVKPNRSGLPNVNFGLQPGGRFTATNVPVQELIRSAYGVSNFQLVDLPDWTRSERFDIVAKAPGNPGPPEVFLMLRVLLADRFHLAVHNGKRELSVYALVTKSGSAIGPRLRLAATDCAKLMAAIRNGAPVPPSSRVLCGTRVRAGRVEEGGRTMAEIAESFWPLVHAIVVNETGLDGTYDLDLDFAPDSASTDLTPVQSDSPSIFTAVQEQLGLKLNPTKAPVDVLVIDHVEPPTPD